MSPQLKTLIDALAVHYPVFRQPLPLALDTRKRVADMAGLSGLSEVDIHYAVKTWTRLTRYQKALAAPGTMRYSLEGEPVEPVTPEHQKGAAVVLAGIKARAKAKAKAQRLAAVPAPEPVAAVPEPPARPMLKLKKAAV